MARLVRDKTVTMKTDWKTNGPVVTGGMGGSGTRLVAELCSHFGIYIGDDLNVASDNLLYTLLFRRRIWFYKTYQNKKQMGTGLSLLEKLLLKNYGLSPKEIWFLIYAVTDMTLHYLDERIWSFGRLQQIIRNPRFNDHSYQGWGWKEPNSHLLLSNLSEQFQSLKFIHTIRHGADMAFSQNQRQLRAWGDLFGIPTPTSDEEIPRASLKFWAKTNKSVAELGKSLGSKRYIQINFDTLCKTPGKIINDLISFLEIDIDQDTYQAALAIPKIPKTLGRYKSHDLSQFDPEDLEIVKSFGFSLDQ